MWQSMFERGSKLNSSQAAEKTHQTQNVNSSSKSFIAHYQAPTHGTARSLFLIHVRISDVFAGLQWAAGRSSRCSDRADICLMSSWWQQLSDLIPICNIRIWRPQRRSVKLGHRKTVWVIDFSSGRGCCDILHVDYRTQHHQLPLWPQWPCCRSAGKNDQEHWTYSMFMCYRLNARLFYFILRLSHGRGQTWRWIRLSTRFMLLPILVLSLLIILYSFPFVGLSRQFGASQKTPPKNLMTHRAMTTETLTKS